MVIAWDVTAGYSRHSPETPRSETGPLHGVREAEIASEAVIRSGLLASLPRLWRYAFVLSRQRDVADDLVQQTCVRALERCGQFVTDGSPDRWFFSILHSVWLNEARARKVRLGQGLVPAEEHLAFDGAREAELRADAGKVLRLVNALPEAQRAAVFLAYVEGLTYREVAEILDIPIGTVMSRLAAARAKLAAGTDGGV